MLKQLLDAKLISDKDAETIRKGKQDQRPVISPTKWMYWNVHIDGLEYTLRSSDNPGQAARTRASAPVPAPRRARRK